MEKNLTCYATNNINFQSFDFKPKMNLKKHSFKKVCGLISSSKKADQYSRDQGKQVDARKLTIMMIFGGGGSGGGAYF